MLQSYEVHLPSRVVLIQSDYFHPDVEEPHATLVEAKRYYFYIVFFEIHLIFIFYTCFELSASCISPVA